MLETALKVLKEIESSSQEAYIVGGFVRDYLLGISSNDIDMNTSATPKELKELFPDSTIPKDDYGSVTLMRKNIRFEITTFRKEYSYKNHRQPVKIEYVDSLYQDLLRRDFTINAICMNQQGEIIDLLKGKKDLEDRIIRTIGNSDDKLKEDALRILRAIRFATTLDFSLSPEIEEAILKNKHLLKDISYERKREELDKIFANHNTKKGISLLLKFGLEESLDIPLLSTVTSTDSLMGIWAVLDVLDLYPFTANEKDLIEGIKKAYQCDNLDPYNLYKYGLYINSVAGEMKGESVKKITEAYQQLPIHERRDIAVDGDLVMETLNRQPGPYLNQIFKELERKILYRELKNEKDVLLDYCCQNFKNEI